MEFLQFAFRWVNCLLARELPFQLAVRLWDTYLAEGPRMKEFLIYVLASFVLSWSAELSRMEFQVTIPILPTLFQKGFLAPVIGQSKAVCITHWPPVWSAASAPPACSAFPRAQVLRFCHLKFFAIAWQVQDLH